MSVYRYFCLCLKLLFIYYTMNYYLKVWHWKVWIYFHMWNHNLPSIKWLQSYHIQSQIFLIKSSFELSYFRDSLLEPSRPWISWCQVDVCKGASYNSWSWNLCPWQNVLLWAMFIFNRNWWDNYESSRHISFLVCISCIYFSDDITGYYTKEKYGSLDNVKFKTRNSTCGHLVGINSALKNSTAICGQHNPGKLNAILMYQTVFRELDLALEIDGHSLYTSVAKYIK